MSIRLIDVYESIMQDPVEETGVSRTHMVLYELLLERTPETNISHKGMPSLEGHVKFVDSMPYSKWYLIQDWPDTYEEAVFEKKRPEWTGSIYLTDRREVGIFVFKKRWRQGIGKAAIEELLQRHPGNLLANINPNNERSIQFFEELGAKHIQNTYEICGGD